jgi:hypothetical protein
MSINDLYHVPQETTSSRKYFTAVCGSGLATSNKNACNFMHIILTLCRVGIVQPVQTGAMGWRAWDGFLAGARHFLYCSVQTGSEVHSAPTQWVPVHFPRRRSARGMKRTIPLHLWRDLKLCQCSFSKNAPIYFNRNLCSFPKVEKKTEECRCKYV